jgi:hypothetical protein
LGNITDGEEIDPYNAIFFFLNSGANV